MIILLFYHIVQIAVLKSILGHIECTQCIICDLLLLMSHAVWSVCLSVCWWHGCIVQKKPNRSRCCLGLTLVGHRNNVLDVVKTGRIHPQPRGVINRRFGLLLLLWTLVERIGDISRWLWQAFRQVNFQEDVALQSSRRPSLVSLNNESQVDNDDVDSDSDEDSLHDDRSLSAASSADRSEVRDDPRTDCSATPVWHRMQHALSKVAYSKTSKVK